MLCGIVLVSISKVCDFFIKFDAVIVLLALIHHIEDTLNVLLREVHARQVVQLGEQFVRLFEVVLSSSDIVVLSTRDCSSGESIKISF